MARSTWALLALVLVLGCKDSATTDKQPSAKRDRAAGPFAADHDAMMRDVRDSLMHGKDVTPRVLANGHMIAELPGESSVVLARRNADGTIERVCVRSEEHTSELQSRLHLVCRLLLEK